MLITRTFFPLFSSEGQSQKYRLHRSYVCSFGDWWVGTIGYKLRRSFATAPCLSTFPVLLHDSHDVSLHRPTAI
ncbi:hypothetical protein Aduo_014388 [Ancylostoma duodenale]